MSSTALRRSLAALLAAAGGIAALPAQGIPIGFEEQYALAPDRAAVVANLIPGTEEWYYYHCRERLDARDFAAVRKALPTWIQRHGRTDRVVEIENREALLSFGDDPERTYDFLRQRLGLTFAHQRVVPGARSDLPTRLDPALISAAALTARAFAAHPKTVDGFTDRALPALLAAPLDDEQLTSLLRRLDRPDVENLPAMVVRELSRRESAGFGAMPVHRMLRLPQLDACLDLRRELLQDQNFVQAYLVRLQPDADTAWQVDPAAREVYLRRLWSFAQRLAPTFNSLKAHVLYHWLRHDLTQGAPDKERFLAYIRLPRRQGHPARAHLQRHQRSAEFVDLGGTYPTSMPAIGNDEPLVQQCLEHFFATEDGTQAYSDYLDARWLDRVLAETRILRGEGDMERWYSLLNDPGYLEQLEKRVELTFPPSQPELYGAEDPVRITVDTKNVPTLLVKVFAIDSYRYHVERQREVDATIELDGVVANFEQTHEYGEPALRRVRRTFDLPMLRDPGTYVVEFVGNGISSRAVIHKGGLKAVSRVGAAGHVVRVYDERGAHVPAASAWFGGREYLADDRGEIVLPFSTDPGQKKLVLRHGSRSSIVAFEHAAESYALRGHVHAAREALIAGATARLVVRPQLEVAGAPASLQLLKEPMLTIVATDLDGLSTTQEVRDLAVADGRELVHELQIPSRLTSLTVTLTAKVEGLDGKPVELNGGTTSFPINGIDATPETSVPLLSRTSTGYVVDLRGKNGEPQGGRVCHLALYHRDYRDAIQVSLQTDAQGRVQLGDLTGIERVQIQKAGGTGGMFTLANATCRLPVALHGTPEDTLRVPYQGSRTAPNRGELSLLGHDRDAFEHLAIQDGFVELRKLPPGDYVLMLHDAGARIPVRITQGRHDDRWLIGADRLLSASPTRPLQVREVAIDGDALRVRVANATRGTRVTVVATRYLPAFDLFDDLAGDDPARPVAFDLDRPLSSYHAGRKLGDEYRYVLERRFATKYPGNMLERPSLLLHGWALDVDSQNDAIGLGGGAGGRFGSRGGRRGARSQQQGGEPGGLGAAPNSGTIANLDFLPRDATIVANLALDADGVVRLPLAQLGDGQQLHVLALDGAQAIYETAVRPERTLEPRSRALAQALASDRHFVEQRRIEFVAAGGTATIDDADATQAQVHDSLASVYRLFATVSKNQDLQRFGFVLDWPTLKPEQKLELYDRHACHELHFFLFEKDPEFFRGVVRPFLENKLDRTFMDEWLLEQDLRGYLEPWRFAQLNLIEKILLAKRLGGTEPEAVARLLREALELQPIAYERLEQLFDLSLKSDELAANARTGSDDFFLGVALEPMQAPKAGGGGGGPVAGRPGAPAAPAPDAAAGPQTGGPGGPPAAERLRRAAEKKEAQDARDKDAPAEAELAEEVVEEAGNVDRGLLSELERRKNVQQLYRAVARTKLLVESNWWHRRMEEPTTGVVGPNRFWVDFATAPSGAPFVSAALVEATGSFLEMMMALSVLDLPFTPGEHEFARDGDRRTLRAASPLLLVRKEVTPTSPTRDAEPLLLGQNFFRLDDRYRYVNGERRDAFVTDEFLVDVAYGCQVVVTNPTSGQRVVEILLQIPAGAVPLQSGFWTRGRTVQLAPYATATLEYSFYFPATGSFAHYPVHAAEKGQLVAFAAPRSFAVVAEPSRIDTTSWEHVSQQGSPQEVLEFLDGHNVQRFDLDKIAWRMRDRAFFAALLQKLRARHVYHDTLWSYAVLHREPAAAREYLRHQDGFLDRCGTWLDSTLVSIDPKERRRFQQVEFDPLVHARAHQLGSSRVFGNKDLARQYAALMDLLGYRPRLDSGDWLAVTYYLLLQDRVEEALATFAKVDPNEVPARVQHDYLSAYLCFFTGDEQKARRIAEAHRDHPVAHWRRRFREVLTQLDEAEGRARPTSEGQSPDALAATAPALELAVEGRTVALSYKNLTQCEVRYYLLDVEFAFSAQPFAGPDGASAAFVRPNLQETKDLPRDASQLAFELPQQFWQKNVLVEVRAAGLVRSRQYFTSALDVRFLESYGQVAVHEPDSGRPLAKTYVKVFARLPNGQVRFHKDGYTDLRGRFDYASVSDDPNAGANRYAVLVLDERRGAVIREIAPPAR